VGAGDFAVGCAFEPSVEDGAGWGVAMGGDVGGQVLQTIGVIVG